MSRKFLTVAGTALIIQIEKYNILCDRCNSNYLCTYDLYVPVRNVFDAGKWERVGRWVLEMDSFWALPL